MEKNEDNYILIQKSKYQNKNWRKNQNWYYNGKHNECEIYQKEIIEQIIKQKCNKTNDRINTNNLEILIKININRCKDGFEWTENFDGIVNYINKCYYFNLKFVCDKGGSQTRTLREVYYFIKYQLENLLKFKSNNIFFINILDGDTCYNCMDKFKYLSSKKEYNSIIKYIFIGDMFKFQIFWKNIK